MMDQNWPTLYFLKIIPSTISFNFSTDATSISVWSTQCKKSFDGYIKNWSMFDHYQKEHNLMQKTDAEKITSPLITEKYLYNKQTPNYFRYTSS